MKKTLFFALIFSIFTLISGFSKSGKPIYQLASTEIAAYKEVKAVSRPK